MQREYIQQEDGSMLAVYSIQERHGRCPTCGDEVFTTLNVDAKLADLSEDPEAFVEQQRQMLLEMSGGAMAIHERSVHQQ